MTAKEQIQKYIDFKGISVYRLEADAGLSKGYWGKTKSISADVAIKISRIYSDISAEWLLRGNGEMIKSGECESTDITNNELQTCKQQIDNSTIEELKAEIVALKAENSVLREIAGLGVKKESKSA